MADDALPHDDELAFTLDFVCLDHLIGRKAQALVLLGDEYGRDVDIASVVWTLTALEALDLVDDDRKLETDLAAEMADEVIAMLDEAA